LELHGLALEEATAALDERLELRAKEARTRQRNSR
jgi:hypothetical protein